jgi:hypothetical protein
VLQEIKEIIGGVPLFRQPSARSVQLCPDQLSIFVVKHKEFLELDAQTIQEIFRHRNILVLDTLVEKVESDWDGLLSLGSLTQEHCFQG